MGKSIVFIDVETSVKDKKILDLGAVRTGHASFHSSSISQFYDYIAGAQFICGHNILHHDLQCLQKETGRLCDVPVIDTLYLSPLLFPECPYHALVKDDKLLTDQLNNPVNDCKKASDLFYEEASAFMTLPDMIQQIFCTLLYQYPEFNGFFRYVDYAPGHGSAANMIQSEFDGKICAHADVEALVREYPVELAYALALIAVEDDVSITPPWLMRNYPKIENVIKQLCNTPCTEGCPYCREKLNIHRALKQIFHYDEFRTYDGEALQERAAQAAVDGKSLLAIFPTGGGKSITFQLPALMAGKAAHGLTVVISPLQSLMKDQVDNLNRAGITEAVTINGLLSPVERANAIDRVANGSAHLLYISPEQLRSCTVEKLLLSRNVIRFVIDEAHCFSAWGHDFRVDYLYIGDFIRELQQQKRQATAIPVSCFTATAKQKVIQDICAYFKEKLNVELEKFTSSTARENLQYTVLYQENDEKKYNALRDLITQKNCPTIVYVSRTKRTQELADKLTQDGFKAKPFNGKMDSDEKIANQDAFIQNEIQVIVATSAFGMGVDKKDVKLVVHYDISSSLEDYVQEAGRAGRDPTMQAECYVLYHDDDLYKHFILLNQTKLTIREIQQIWRAVKRLTKVRPKICCSALEVAREAGWDDSVYDIETRVKTAVAALENAGYLKRGRNVPRVYATSILVKNTSEATLFMNRSKLFSVQQSENAQRIISSLISKRRNFHERNANAESRVDYLADTLGIQKKDVIEAVNLMRQAGILEDWKDMSAYILGSDKERTAFGRLKGFARLEYFFLSQLSDTECDFNFKKLNELAQNQGIAKASVKGLRTLIYYYAIKNYIHKSEYNSMKDIKIVPTLCVEQLKEKYELRIKICGFILKTLYERAHEFLSAEQGKKPVLFSLVKLHRMCQEEENKLNFPITIHLSDIEDALLYLSKIGVLKLEGGFLVLYQGMEIERLELDNRIRYKLEDYQSLGEFYRQKIHQIHMVGEYANLMVHDSCAAQQYVQDYFAMDSEQFIAKYFKGERAKEIDRNITPAKYQQLFGGLSEKQSQIIYDADSQYIVVAAGPGSGKTRVLVHKLAALLLLEDVKHEQLLMLTFSRAAATEFKKRLAELIGNAANFIEIKTFHSYCFDLLGRVGNLEKADQVVKNAADLIDAGEVEPSRITKSVLVIDEAQDMDGNEFHLVQALIQRNEDMRMIAVGDDDQSIYEFRKASPSYMRALIERYGALQYEMVENYRSRPNIVALANAFAASIQHRMKTASIQAVQQENGTVEIIHHVGRYMEEAVVAHVMKTPHTGTCCILTKTNDEAIQIASLLQKHNLCVKLVQDLGGFSLYNLAEIRFFLKKIDEASKSPVITDRVWNMARKRLFVKYAKSQCLEMCENLIHDFETTHAKKYRTDLEEFLRESNYEDFYRQERNVIYVSTVHKAKGREFDTVYMMLNGSIAVSDEEKRVLYVGLTRAKQALYIHCNTEFFSQYRMPGVTHIKDQRIYPEQSEISLMLTHRDVDLGFFKDKKQYILRLRSGSKLQSIHYDLCAKVDGRALHLVRFSKAFQRKLDALHKKGYRIVSAEVRFVLAWKAKDAAADDEEKAIVLPNLYLKRQ